MTNRYQKYWRCRFEYMILFVATDCIRTCSTLILMTELEHSTITLLVTYLAIQLISSFPSIFLVINAESESWNQYNNKLVKFGIIMLIIIKDIGYLIFLQLPFSILVSLFLNTYIFFVQSKWCSKNLIESHPTIFNYLQQSKNYQQTQQKIIAMNYVIMRAYCNQLDSNDNNTLIQQYENKSLQIYIENCYINNQCKYITFNDIRQHSYDLWCNNSSFLSFLSYCEYYSDFEKEGKPTKLEWIYAKICYLFNIIRDIFIHLIPFYFIFGSDKYPLYQSIIFVIFIILECITWYFAIKYVFPFYYCIANFVPYLFDREREPEITNDQEIVITKYGKRVYQELFINALKSDIIMLYVHPKEIAEIIISFIKIKSLQELNLSPENIKNLILEDSIDESNEDVKNKITPIDQQYDNQFLVSIVHNVTK
eukprot:420611_1